MASPAGNPNNPAPFDVNKLSKPSTNPSPTLVTGERITPPGRNPSSKMPCWRHLGGRDRVVYDVDSRLPGESQPPQQLEATPIAKYASDPGLVHGRQIAVNRTYLCYGLEFGAIQVLNKYTALKSLLRGHTQRVTDMAFFGQDVDFLASASVDGRVFVWKINEEPDDEDKPLITGKIVAALQIVGYGEAYHPCICWHSSGKEILIVGIGNSVLKIDTTKVGRGKEFSAEEPLQCPMDKLIDGVQLIENYDGEVTDLSMSLWLLTRLVSASKDGTMITTCDISRHLIFEASNFTVIPVCEEMDDHYSFKYTVKLNQRSAIDLRKILESFVMYRTLVTQLLLMVPLLWLFEFHGLVCEAKIWNFRKMKPIVTLRPHDGQPVNCVAFLRASHRPDHIVLVTAGPLNREVKIWASAALKGWLLCNDSESWHCLQTLELRSSSEPRADEAFFNQVVVLAHSNLLLLANAKKNAIYAVHVDYGPYPAATRMDYITDFTVAMPILSLIGTRDFFSDVEQIVQVYCVQTQAIQQYALDLSQWLPPTVETMGLGKEPSLPHVSYMPISEGFIVVDPSRPVGSGLPNPPLSVINSEASLHPVASDASESGSGQHAEFYIEAQVVSEVKEKPLSSQASEAKIEMDKDCSTLRTETNDLEKVQSHLVDGVAVIEALEQASNIGDEGIQECMKDMPVKASEASLDTTSQSLSITKGKKQKGKLSQSSIPSPPSSSPFNSMESFDEQGIVSSAPSIDISISQIQSMYESLSQHEKVERDHLQQLTNLNSNYMNKELPAILERALEKEISAVGPVLAHTITPIIEKTISAAVDDSFQRGVGGKALSQLDKSISSKLEATVAQQIQRQFQTSGKQALQHEKVERDRLQQLTNLNSNYMNKELPAILERALEKEISAVGPVLAHTITPVIEKTISSAIDDSFQRGVGDKALSQLDKSIRSELEATVARQIQGQLQTSGKQALQDALWLTLQSPVIPVFEHSCKSKFEQVDAAFQKWMAEHTVAAQQQFESTHTPLVLNLKDAIYSASSMVHYLTSVLDDAHRRLGLGTSGNTNAPNPMAMQQSNNPGIVPEMNALPVEPPIDPKNELTKLIIERKFEEAFILALTWSDPTILSWLCSQFDARTICSMVPPLSQMVLLSLLQRLTFNVGNETSRKLGWIKEVAAVINPTDPLIAILVRPALDQVYSTLTDLTTNSGDVVNFVSRL